MNQTLTVEQIISAIKQMPQEDRRVILSALANSENADIEVQLVMRPIFLNRSLCKFGITQRTLSTMSYKRGDVVLVVNTSLL